MIDRIVLVGFMCSGKSTVGPLLAGRLGWDFIDFDESIERDANQSIAEMGQHPRKRWTVSWRKGDVGSATNHR